MSVISTPFTTYYPPSWDVLWLRQVYGIAEKSKDPRTKMGVVLVRNNIPIMSAFNGIPETIDDDHNPNRHFKPLKKIWYEHAERNAIYNCAGEGISTKDSILYIQGLPCYACARAVIRAKITKIVYHVQWMELETYSDEQKFEYDETRKMLEESSIEVVPINVSFSTLGVNGYFNGNHIVGDKKSNFFLYPIPKLV